MSIDDFKLLTEDEAAAALGCNRLKIKRLRMAGRLPYIPGRPVLIHQRDLEAFQQEEALRATQPKWAWGTGLSEDAIRAAEARRWALEAVLKPKRVKRSPQP